VQLQVVIRYSNFFLTLLLFFIEFKIYKVDRMLSNECGGKKKKKRLGMKKM
jgi:hypothetical protein